MANGEYEPFKVGDFVNSCRTGHQVGTGCVNFLVMLPGAVLGWLTIFANLMAMWGTLLIRGQIGTSQLILPAFFGVLLHHMVTGVYIDSAGAILLYAWSVSLLVVWLCHLVARAQRAMSRPRTHIHSRCIGAPLGPMYRLWNPLMRRWAGNPLRVALIGEPLFFFCVAVVFGVAEPIMAEIWGGKVMGIWLVPALTGGAIWTQAAIVAVSDHRQLTLLADQEVEQTDMSESMMHRPGAVRERESEGYAVFEAGDAQEGGVS